MKLPQLRSPSFVSKSSSYRASADPALPLACLRGVDRPPETRSPALARAAPRRSCRRRKVSTRASSSHLGRRNCPTVRIVNALRAGLQRVKHPKKAREAGLVARIIRPARRRAPSHHDSVMHLLFHCNTSGAYRAMLLTSMPLTAARIKRALHWDSAGHLDRGYATLRRVHATEGIGTPDPRAFLLNPNHTASLALQSGVQFLDNVTRANSGQPDNAEQMAAEDLGVPFERTELSTELGESTDPGSPDKDHVAAP